MFVICSLRFYATENFKNTLMSNSFWRRINDLFPLEIASNLTHEFMLDNLKLFFYFLVKILIEKLKFIAF